MVDVEKPTGVDIPEATQDTPSEKPTEISDSSSNDEAAQKATDEAGHGSEQSSDETPVTPSEGGEQSSGQQKDVFQVGEKTYTKADLDRLENDAGKVGKFQRDRDMTDRVLQGLAGQIKGMGLDVDNNFNIIKPQQQGPTEQELVSAAMAGDEAAFNTLRERDRQKTQHETMQNFTQLNDQKEVLNYVRTNYSDLYTKDDKGNILKDAKGNDLVNPDSPISREAQTILNENPQLAHPTQMKLVAQLAQARLNEKNLGKVEKGIRTKAQQRFNEGSASATATPSSGGQTEDLSGLLSADQIRVSVKGLGGDAKRLGAIIKKAQANQGRYIVE